MRASLQIPIFPLMSTLWPGGRIPLRIFEIRYLDMITQCLKKDSGFGVCLIRQGKEVGAAAEPYSVGTLAHIIDWTQHEDGLLGITVEGRARFNIESKQVMQDQLLVAEVELFSQDSIIQIPEHYEPLVEKLDRAYAESGKQYAPEKHLSGDANWLSYRLAEILQLDEYKKQVLLEMTDPVERLDRISDWA